MHNPENEDEFREVATCPNGHTGEVDFHFVHEKYAPKPTGSCEECEVVFEYESEPSWV